MAGFWKGIWNDINDFGKSVTSGIGNIPNFVKDTWNQITGKSNREATERANTATLASNEAINQASLQNQKEINDANIAMQRETNQQNLDLANQANAFEKEKFEYDQWLNANQNQLAANDRSKAGLNPIGAANLSTVGVGGMQTAGTIAPQAQASAQLHPTNFIAEQYDTSFMSTAVSKAVDRMTAKQNNALVGRQVNLAFNQFENEKAKLELERERLEEEKRATKKKESQTDTRNTNDKIIAMLDQVGKYASMGLSADDIESLTGYRISDELYKMTKKMHESSTRSAESSAKLSESSAKLNEQLAEFQEENGVPLEAIKAVGNGTNVNVEAIKALNKGKAADQRRRDQDAQIRRDNVTDFVNDLYNSDGFRYQRNMHIVSKNQVHSAANYAFNKNYASVNKAYEDYKLATMKKNEISYGTFRYIWRIARGN